ncbi:unnamed protein product [Sphenostylis stenocarpa]|uniref:Uncharacterized protein n=1 Tax=Sphenostylis stenocarpa TaxID=92480 RepID=A0AA86SQ14_9FABA|nr:unnamed protein product [Sphenostylis stenocarpa]
MRVKSKDHRVALTASFDDDDSVESCENNDVDTLYPDLLIPTDNTEGDLEEDWEPPLELHSATDLHLNPNPFASPSHPRPITASSATTVATPTNLESPEPASTSGARATSTLKS